MNKQVAELRGALSRPKAPDVSASLCKRLRAMGRQCATVARVGGGFGSAEVENFGRDLADLAREAGSIQPQRPVGQNAQVLAACLQVFDAEGVLNDAFRALRERIEADEADPTGQILATLQQSRHAIAKAEAILTGRMAS